LLVGSNPAVTRVLRTYLQREGVLCREATPESVMRAATRYEASGEVDGLYLDAVEVALVVASVGIDVARLRAALTSLPASASAPILTVDSLAGEGNRPGSASPVYPILAWPFRLRDVMDAITTAVAVWAGPPCAVRPQVPNPPLSAGAHPDLALADAAVGGGAHP
jgi:hypothetical protein